MGAMNPHRHVSARTLEDMTASDALVLPGSPVPLRRLRAEESPYPGVLCAGEPPVICVDDDDLPAVLWNVAADGHLLAPLDALRTADGTAALIPACRARLDSGAATTPGRAITVAISIVRAAHEAGPLGHDAGTWWVDAGGRPVLALGSGIGWREDAAEILAGMAETHPGALERVLTRIAAGIADASLVRRHADEWEDALFAAAEPEPLADLPPGESATTDTAPRRATAVRREHTVSPAVSTVGAMLARLVDADIARRTTEAVSKACEAVLGSRRRTPRREPEEVDGPRRRRGPLLAAIAVIGVMVTLGLVWPDPDTASDAAAPVASAPPVVMTPVPSDTTSAPPPAPEMSALESGARAAIGLLAQCSAGDAEACATVREDPTQPLPEGLVVSGREPTTIAVLDEYGGVAVVRADGAGFTSQAVVLVQADERWLVRDVYDLADQP